MTVYFVLIFLGPGGKFNRKWTNQAVVQYCWWARALVLKVFLSKVPFNPFPESSTCLQSETPWNHRISGWKGPQQSPGPAFFGKSMVMTRWPSQANLCTTSGNPAFPEDIPRAGCSHNEISTLQGCSNCCSWLLYIGGSLPRRTWLLPPPVPCLQQCPVHFCTAPAPNLKSRVRKEGKTNTQQHFLVIINIFIVKNTIK